MTTTNIFVPSNKAEDWQSLLADPEKHWVSGYSARTLAHSWQESQGFPAEVARVLTQHPKFQRIELLLAFPEWKVALPGGSRSSQNDVWALAKCDDGLVSIAVEGKVDESFDRILSEWKAEASKGKEVRLNALTETLGLKAPIPDTVRYQLLHRTASAILEARRFCANHAVMLVHSFSPTNRWFDDFSAFASLFDLKPEIGQLVTTKLQDGMSLSLAWVHGDKKFLLT